MLFGASWYAYLCTNIGLNDITDRGAGTTIDSYNAINCNAHINAVTWGARRLLWCVHICAVCFFWQWFYLLLLICQLQFGIDWINLYQKCENCGLNSIRWCKDNGTYHWIFVAVNMAFSQRIYLKRFEVYLQYFTEKWSVWFLWFIASLHLFFLCKDIEFIQSVY